MINFPRLHSNNSASKKNRSRKTGPVNAGRDLAEAEASKVPERRHDSTHESHSEQASMGRSGNDSDKAQTIDISV